MYRRGRRSEGAGEGAFILVRTGQHIDLQLAAFGECHGARGQQVGAHLAFGALATGELRRVAILVGNNGLFLDYELERGADGANTGYAFPDMLCDVVRMSAAGEREAAHDLFDAHLPLLRYEQQPGVGLAVRKYVLMRRGLLASASMRKPAAALSDTARAEVEHLLGRLARHDPRARI